MLIALPALFKMYIYENRNVDCVFVLLKQKNINYSTNVFSTWCYARKQSFKSATPPNRCTARHNRCNKHVANKGTLRHFIYSTQRRISE